MSIHVPPFIQVTSSHCDTPAMSVYIRSENSPIFTTVINVACHEISIDYQLTQITQSSNPRLWTLTREVSHVINAHRVVTTWVGATVILICIHNN